MKVGNSDARAWPSWARDSASRAVATRTSRFCAATRCSSAVSSASWNRFHQSGSIGVATGREGSGGTFSFGPANQDVGDAHDGTWKFGPTVQPPRGTAMVSTAPAARTTRSIAPHFGFLRRYSAGAAPFGIRGRNRASARRHVVGTPNGRKMSR